MYAAETQNTLPLMLLIFVFSFCVDTSFRNHYLQPCISIMN